MPISKRLTGVILHVIFEKIYWASFAHKEIAPLVDAAKETNVFPK
jgi:hypothetical protein